MEPATGERWIFWTVVDPRGLAISLTEDVWLDHVRKHPEIEDYFEEIKLTAQEPDEIYFDPLSSKKFVGARHLHQLHGPPSNLA